MTEWIAFRSTELYPVYQAIDAADDEALGYVVHEVDDETLSRWKAAEVAFWQAQVEMKNMVDPPCPECGHRKSRHQEFSPGWDYWGCLDRTEKGSCRCQHGIPAERLAQTHP